MALVKTPEQIKHIRALASVISDILEESIRTIAPGITTRALDENIECMMSNRNVHGPCKGYYNFPAVSCISVNNYVTHGIPNDIMLRDGDIVDVDIVIEKDGYFADVSQTVGVGNISTEALQLITTTEECLSHAIAIVRPGARLGDIAHTIQCHAEAHGYSVVRDYCGHFIGLEMHEDPSVLNYGQPHKGLELKPGMIFCIEPMINQGRRGVLTDKNGWNVRTRDGKLSSRCEHMVLVTQEGCEVLTRHPR